MPDEDVYDIGGKLHFEPRKSSLEIMGDLAWEVLIRFAIAGTMFMAFLGGNALHAVPLPILGPYAASTNHSDDIQGTPDSRPGTWGSAGYNVHTFTFHPPVGYSTRVLRVYGNVQGFLRKPPAAGTCAGVLWGLQSTAPDGSARMNPAADNTFLYIQDATCGAPWRDAVDVDTHVNGLLADNVLYSKVAVFLNETGEAVHIEPSWTTVYQFEPTAVAVPPLKAAPVKPTAKVKPEAVDAPLRSDLVMAGTIYCDTTINAQRVYNGQQWFTVYGSEGCAKHYMQGIQSK